MKSLLQKIKGVAREVSANRPALRKALVDFDMRKELTRHSLGAVVPQLIRPKLKQMTVAITAHCNLRCVGCRYGRDFMPGKQLSLGMVKDLLTDGRAGGAEVLRLYGGEPLLHPDLPATIRHGVELGFRTYVTTNGILLRDRIEELHRAGLRDLSLGFYGFGDEYDRYVQKSGRFQSMVDGLQAVRDCCGDDFRMQLNFLIMRPTANMATLDAAWELVERFDMTFHTDLIHYSLPYFVQGLDHELQFQTEDRPAVEAITAEILRRQALQPQRVPESEMAIRSIPDWLFKGPDMRVPCDAYRMIWIGADGSVKLCYVCFDLGNLHEKRLSAMLFSDAHIDAARGAFQLNCPNCHCERQTRIPKHLPSRLRYG
jgi:MoaA/NifB/PqqE/SkfB family radical SAM enzyme